MNIYFDAADTRSVGKQTNVDRDTTSYRTSQSTGKVDAGGFALDISGTVMDNSAYAGHGRTAEEVMLDAGQQDITARRNYMAVMSNSMSDEDFAKLQEEGFHPGSTDIETVVTIVDHIKAALVKGGTQVTGYTDTVSEDKLREITGSETFARELMKQFQSRDVPVTEENAQQAVKAWNMLKEVDTLSPDSMKYMVENDREPTPENLYTARFSAVGGSARQGKGYYADGSVAGYYAKKPEDIKYENLLPQMEKVVEEAGYEGNEENLAGAGWLVENGIPLNADTFSRFMEINKLQLPVTEKSFLEAAAAAAADGKPAAKADLAQKESVIEQAVRISEEVREASGEAADLVQTEGLPFTLRNLKAAQNRINSGKQEAGDEQQEISGGQLQNIRGRRLLEEVRLSMTAESNIKLLRSGFQIETAPMEELIKALKAAEEEIDRTLTGETDAQAAGQKASLYRETMSEIQAIRTVPIDVTARISGEDKLSQVHQKGTDLAAAYEKAGQAYEQLMTAPRKDMGDTISKAFRNVDDILEDLGIAPGEASRRAVRILGYNKTEITVESIEQIEKNDALLTDVIDKMKPGKVLGMIREGTNPLEMSLEELSEYLDGQTDAAQEMESYSRFLYKLEKQNDITEEERSAFIGIYRLTRQLEKTDDAAVGALWQMNAELTLENLLTANRSLKRTNREYTVDESFGGVEAVKTDAEDILRQIEKGFAPDKREWKQLLEQAGSREAGAEYEQYTDEQIRTVVKAEEEVLRQLSDYGQPVTADNLQAMQLMLKSPGQIWRDLGNMAGKIKADGGRTAQGRKTGKAEESSAEASGETDIQEILDEAAGLTDALDGREHAVKAYGSFTDRIQEILEEQAFSDESRALDVRAMSTLYKQMSFLAGMAREENYEIPVSINGSLTAINLKILHAEGEQSKAAVTLETREQGKIAAELRMTEKGFSGICICSTGEGTESLKNQAQLFKEKLEEQQLPYGEIYFAEGEKLDLAEFSLKETRGRTQGGSTDELYKAAKAFIGYVQEAAQRKEAKA